MNSATTTKAAGRRPAPARGGLKYLITAATAAVVVGGWGLIAENPIAAAGTAGEGPTEAQPAARQSLAAPQLAAPQPQAPAVLPATGLRPVTLPQLQPRIRTRSSR